MQFPLSAAAQVQPRLHCRNPHELHWKSTPTSAPVGPDSGDTERASPLASTLDRHGHGDIERSLQHHYPHLADQHCCLQCRSVPCPYDHDGEKKRRMRDLRFVRELFSEKTQLAALVETMREKMEGAAEREREWGVQQTLMKNQLRDVEKKQQELARQKDKLKSDLHRLHRLNDEHLTKLASYDSDRRKIETLTNQVEELETQVVSITEEKQRVRQLVLSQSERIDSMLEESRSSEVALDEATATVGALTFKLAQSEERVGLVTSQLEGKDAEVAAVQTLSEALVTGLEAKVSAHRALQAAWETRENALQSDIEDLRAQFARAQQDGDDLRAQLAARDDALRRLQRRLATSGHFERFVEIKREMNNLQDINASLQRLEPLPLMTSSGRVTSARVTTARVTSAPPGRMKSATRKVLLAGRMKSVPADENEFFSDWCTADIQLLKPHR